MKKIHTQLGSNRMKLIIQMNEGSDCDMVYVVVSWPQFTEHFPISSSWAKIQRIMVRGRKKKGGPAAIYAVFCVSTAFMRAGLFRSCAAAWLPNPVPWPPVADEPPFEDENK